MREHHPMRYHRMTEILKTVASVKLSSTFLLKSYFLKKPLPMLMALYFFNLFAVGYIGNQSKFLPCFFNVFSLCSGTKSWDMHAVQRRRMDDWRHDHQSWFWRFHAKVTASAICTFVISHFSSLVSRCMICMLSLFGIFQTALIVGVLSEALVIPPDEKRILASVEKQRKCLIFCGI